jgi:hypothetical protein
MNDLEREPKFAAAEIGVNDRQSAWMRNAGNDNLRRPTCTA